MLRVSSGSGRSLRQLGLENGAGRWERVAESVPFPSSERPSTHMKRAPQLLPGRCTERVKPAQCSDLPCPRIAGRERGCDRRALLLKVWARV